LAKLTDRQVERISSATAEPRRCESSMGCGSIVDKHGVSHATISHHLKELETAGLIEIPREGKFGNVSLRGGAY